jgi:hypothetical protein
MRRCDLPKSRDHELDRRREIGVPTTDDAGFPTKAEYVVIDRDNTLRLFVEEDLACCQTKTIRGS